jgi:hypothetical protein
MRKGLVSIVSIGAAMAGAALFISPAGGQTEGEQVTFEVIKDVHGDGPSSGFVVEWECVDELGAPNDSGTLNFDALVDGNQTIEVTVDDFGTCTITETGSNGADLVEYECEFFPRADAATEGTPPGSCVDSQSATFTQFGDFASFLVRNTYEADVLPDDEEPPPPAVTPDVVTATPSFTG